jgi:ribosomal-protein-alanine N-acetyltransferase
MPDERKSAEIPCRVRRFRLGDAAAVMEVYNDSPQAAPWSPDAFERGPGYWGSPLSLVSECAGEMTGFFLGREIADDAEVLLLAVKAKYRRQGHGWALVCAAMEEMRSLGKNGVYLEVRESNLGAIAFYERLGFSSNGRRNNYYRNPDEAAVCMKKILTG